jgi:hypothetical protein
MPKNDFWDILVKTEQKSKKIFLVFPFIYKNIKKQKTSKILLNKIKKLFFDMAPSGSEKIIPTDLERGHSN